MINISTADRSISAASVTARPGSRGRPYLWFHAVLRAVGRAVAMGGNERGAGKTVGKKVVKWVDLGTSASRDVEALKAKFGFEVCADWRRKATYSVCIDGTDEGGDDATATAEAEGTFATYEELERAGAALRASW